MVAWPVAAFSQGSNVGLKDSAAVLAITGFTAVGIERVIEGFWTFIGIMAGSWWPLDDVGKKLNGMVDKLDTTLAPFYTAVSNAITTASNAEKWSQEQLDNANQELELFKKYFTTLKGLAPDSQRAQLISVAALQSVNSLQTKYPDIKNAADLAKEAINGIANFATTFKDNPGRRLISLYMGVFLGLIVAGTLSLNLLTLVVQPVKGPLPPYVLSLGVILTGIVMGLGSNPAHEIIQAIQEYKQNLKSPNTGAS